MSLVRLVVLSDTHGFHHQLTPVLPPGDILLHCGDFANKGSIDDATDFVKWVSSLQQYPEKYIIGGNHDRTLMVGERAKNSNNDKSTSTRLDLKEIFAKAHDSVRLLQDETITTQHGLTIHGSSWNSCEVDSYTNLSTTVDVWMVHRPPRLDRTNSKKVFPKPRHTPHHFSYGWNGSRAITRTVQTYRIPLCLSGHVHMSRGMLKLLEDHDPRSIFINAASCWSDHEQGTSGVSTPVVIDFHLETKKVWVVQFDPHPSSWRQEK